MRLLWRLGIVLFIVLLSFPSAKVNAATVGDISQQLVCQCGCTMVLQNCSHVECASRETMTAMITQKIAQGQSAEQIIQSFREQYGEQVLAAPPKQGFNLTAWLTPLIALLFGGSVAYVALRSWARRGRRPQTNGATGTEEGDTEYWHQLEKELAEFNWRGFR